MKRGRHGKAEEEKKKNRSVEGSRKAWKRGNGEAKTREKKKRETQLNGRDEFMLHPSI